MCDCKEKVNAYLVEKNAELAEVSLMNMATGKVRQSLVIKTAKLDRSIRKWTKAMVPAYCPFCGEKIETTND